MEDDHFILLGQIDGKLDQVLNRLGAVEEDSETHAARIASLEKCRSWVLGATATVSIAVPLFFDTIKKLIANANH